MDSLAVFWKLTFRDCWDGNEEVQVPTLFLIGCAFSDELCDLSGFQFSHP